MNQENTAYARYTPPEGIRQVREFWVVRSLANHVEHMLDMVADQEIPENR